MSDNSQRAMQQEMWGQECRVLIAAMLRRPIMPGPPFLSQVHKN